MENTDHLKYINETKESINRESELHQEKIELAIDSAGLGVWEINLIDGSLVFNDRCAEMLGYTPAEQENLNIMDWMRYLHPEDLKSTYELFVSKKGVFEGTDELELRIKHKDGHYVWVLTTGKIVSFTSKGRPKKMIGTHQEITERKESELKYKSVSKLLEESQRIAKVGGWLYDLTTKEISWTNEVYNILGYLENDFTPSLKLAKEHLSLESLKKLDKHFYSSIKSHEPFDLDLDCITKKNENIKVRITGQVSCRKGRASSFSGIIQDITEQKKVQEILEKANEKLALNANFDSLTGLPNRNLLAERMNDCLNKCSNSHDHAAIAFIDLDGFKEINDKYGHSFGDTVLKQIALQLENVTNEHDTVARLGGDEFIMILNQLKKPEECEKTLNNVLEAISKINFVNDKSIDLSASIGFTIYPQDYGNPDQLIRHADQAMYVAKKEGKNRFSKFDVEKDIAETTHIKEVKGIEEALHNEEFVLFYQPKMNMLTNKIIGLEALIRWNHPEKGLLAPFFFLPIIEEDRLSIDVGEWVIRSGMKQLKSWANKGINLPISVNISPLQLQEENFVDVVRKIISENPDYISGMLEFEILETSAISNIDIVTETIKECKKMGINFSIDDFGTGYSSLSYLKKLPADTLKIDQGFIKHMLENEDDKAIVKGITGLAEIFNKKVIAEGVETIEHGKAILELGCELAQGYGIARPMNVESFETWVIEWEKGNDWEFLAK